MITLSTKAAVVYCAGVFKQFSFFVLWTEPFSVKRDHSASPITVACVNVCCLNVLKHYPIMIRSLIMLANAKVKVKFICMLWTATLD